jgi:hypothetical protein
MKSRRWILWVGLAATLALVVVAVAWRASHRLRLENVARIQVGMTLQEVEDLLGGPPGDYGMWRFGAGEMTQEGVLAPPGSTELVWFDDDNRLEIFVDNENKVVAVHRRARWQRRPFLW